ncbi:MAG: CHRD domain-containing protein [Alteromonadaceae bacterium]|nr:MAG: CHRD domain-containing protein [Alteromonadaceae bacterium]
MSLELSGSQEVPAAVTSASGTADITLDIDSGLITGTILTTGVDGTGAHIHNGFAGENGAVNITLIQDASDASTWLVPENTVLSADDMQSLEGGGMYINVHSGANPGGEIRGQILPTNIQVVWASLAGNKEVPVVTSSATGRAALTINTDTMDLELHAMTMDLNDSSAAHIHQGFAGETGGVAVALEQDASDANHWFVSGGTFTADEMTALWNGSLYVNIHSTTNPGGEIRGQILPTNIQVVWASLAGNKEVPGVTTNATGRAALTINTDTMDLELHAMTMDLSDATDAHIHQSFAGETGGVAVALEQDTSDTNHWFVSGGTFTADQMTALWNGSLYVNVHSTTNPGGEIRGQILPANIQVVWASLAGDKEVPAVTTSATGRAALTINTDTMGLELHAMSMDLNDATDAHIHQGFAGETGGVAVALEQDTSDFNHWFVSGGTFTADQMTALWNGSLYVNVHSATNPGGEIRGQILPSNIQVFWAMLSGDNEVPAVITSATGRAALTINSDTLALVLHAMTTSLDDATGAHIHEGVAGVSGGVAVGLNQDGSDAGHWLVDDATFTQDQYTALLAGGLYVNIHSPANGGGEIRGQLE